MLTFDNNRRLGGKKGSINQLKKIGFHKPLDGYDNFQVIDVKICRRAKIQKIIMIVVRYNMIDDSDDIKNILNNILLYFVTKKLPTEIISKINKTVRKFEFQKLPKI